MSVEQLIDSPGDYDFYQAVYLVEQQLSAEDKAWLSVGKDSFPNKELIRFKSDQHIGFPGRPITKAETRHQSDGKTALDMHVSFMGLTGSSGVLPMHYSELILQCIKNRDTAMRDFFDLFNHRLISLSYRAWKKYRIACHLEQGDESSSGSEGLGDAFSRSLAALTGAENALGIYYGGFFNKVNRSSEGLRQLLTDYLGCRVEIHELEGRWVTLAKQDQTKLPSSSEWEGQYCRLGCEATLGSKVWDISSAIKVVVFPEGEKQVQQLLPGSELRKQLMMLLDNYVNDGVKVKLQITSKLDYLPTTKLGKNNSSLGQTARLDVPLNKRTNLNQEYASI
ncbi:type VI secretion system baseplate subunit TssG [Litoribrevibacter euphylliae]|uniref:Type VI secretion system baseplate subunit TssG n=1 Tax=Litoribrevibacter euphylliae TaxID=1834034 RepID=A0ABV7HCY6_9GAMM